jgi:hypothetical protein
MTTNARTAVTSENDEESRMNINPSTLKGSDAPAVTPEAAKPVSKELVPAVYRHSRDALRRMEHRE